MAVFSFEWKAAGPRPSPSYANFGGEATVQEVASSTYKKGYPLNVDLSESTSTTLVFRAAATDEAVLWLAGADGQNDASNIALTSLPLQLRPGDLVSATLSNNGANLATTVDHIGDRAGWKASSESGETAKAVLDIAETTVEQFIIVGFDDRDAIGTSGGRMIAMYLGAGVGAVDLDIQQN
jgi:hypothetical protein